MQAFEDQYFHITGWEYSDSNKQSYNQTPILQKQYQPTKQQSLNRQNKDVSAQTRDKFIKLPKVKELKQTYLNKPKQIEKEEYSTKRLTIMERFEQQIKQKPQIIRTENSIELKKPIKIKTLENEIDQQCQLQDLQQFNKLQSQHYSILKSKKQYLKYRLQQVSHEKDKQQRLKRQIQSLHLYPVSTIQQKNQKEQSNRQRHKNNSINFKQDLKLPVPKSPNNAGEIAKLSSIINRNYKIF